MFSKLRTMTLVCSVAVMATTAVGLACDKDKQVAAKSSCGSQQTASIVQVADGTKQCSKSKQVETIAVADKSAGCAKSAATQETMALLAKAISAMSNDAARADVITAYRTLAVANPSLTCEKQASAVKAVAISSGCCASKAAQAKNTQVANTTACDPAACSAAKAKATSVANVTTCNPADCAAKVASGACDPAACKAAKAAKATKVAAGQSACSSTAQARYVAFGCEKTDRLARAAANGYLQIMRELKAYSGADGCAASTASKLLAQVLEDQSATAQVVEVETVVNVETVANVETDVSFGAVSDVKKSGCCASKK